MTECPQCNGLIANVRASQVGDRFASQTQKANRQRRLKLYVICDFYYGADHDIDLGTLNVAKEEGGEDSDESDEEVMLPFSNY